MKKLMRKVLFSLIFILYSSLCSCQKKWVDALNNHKMLVCGKCKANKMISDEDKDLNIHNLYFNFNFYFTLTLVKMQLFHCNCCKNNCKRAKVGHGEIFLKAFT